MTDNELLTKIKSGLGITGTYQDETLQIYIAEVKQFLIDAGVALTIVESELSVGVIIRGVADLWNYGSGKSELSPYFIQRVKQLTYKAVSDDVPTE